METVYIFLSCKVYIVLQAQYRVCEIESAALVFL